MIEYSIPNIAVFGVFHDILTLLKVGCMPEISRFYGIIIRMYCEPDERHHAPHFHAYYQDESVVVGIDPIEMMQGGLPPKQMRLVLAWAEIHQRELRKDWDVLQGGQLPFSIEPLK